LCPERNGHPGSFLLVGCVEPQRDRGRLHGLLNHCQHLFTQLLQVHLLTQESAERLKGFGGVILVAIEAPVNTALDTLTERLEEPE